MKKISWIEISLKRYGGFAYNEEAREALSKDFAVEMVNAQPRSRVRFKPFQFFELMRNLVRLEGKSDVWVRNFYATLTLPFDKTEGKQVVVRHHADFSGFPLAFQPFFYVLEKLFEHNLKKIDALVVVSKYWKEYFEKKGFPKVYLIYNAFDLSQFQVSDEEVRVFRKKYNVEDKPIVYLGNCQRAKGVVESFNMLKSLDAHLITSGKPMVNIPAKNLELSYQEYLTLLKAADIVLTMSKFKEGWSRTAHEAMLLKTPVIGSGRGGMKELLEGGEQIVCEDFAKLKSMVQYLLANPEIRRKAGEKGYAFASKFTKEHFKEQWLKCMQMIL